MSKRVLLIEDTPSLSMVYESTLKKSGYEVESVFDASSAMRAYSERQHQILLLDLLLPDGDGFDILHHVVRSDRDAKVVVITANGSINRAIEAMRAGAYEFLVKPFDGNRLLAAVKDASQALEQSGERDLDRAEAEPHGQQSRFIGSGAAMQDIYRMVKSIGRSAATVFITGESGTGKEICAEEIHALSSRRDGPFVPMNCGAIPADLLESEVFGHLKGSFTGAIADKKGAAEAASGGTLFLDEICEMDLSLQTKLLRFLQTSTIQPVGSTVAKPVDVRIICATNRDPAEEVKAGRFREDLYYRLHVVPVHMPPLRDRGEDVIEIADRMLVQFAEEEGKDFRKFSLSIKEIFRTAAWPGNVRQLLNVIRNIVVLNDGTEVLSDMLPAGFLEEIGDGHSDPRTDVTETDTQNVGAAERYSRTRYVSGFSEEQRFAVQSLLGQSLANVERAFIEATVEDCHGSIPQAARRLGVSPSTLYRKFDAWKTDDVER